MGNRDRYLYFTVTNDRFELPLSLPVTIEELAAITGMTAKTIKWSCTPYGQARMRLRGKKGRGYKPFRVARVPIDYADIEDDF